MHKRRIERCREDFLTFGEYVGRDEETQEPIRQGRIHRTIHGILDVDPEVVIFSHIESGKTTSVAILRLIWEIGRNPAIRAGLLSSNETNAGNRLVRAAAYMEESPEYKEVFPHIAKSTRRGDRWAPNEEITVDRPLGPQHPTVRAIGLHNSILSWRCDLLIGDDVLEFKHVITKHERDKVMKWFEMTIMGRLVRSSRAWILGVPHHKEDLLHRLIQRGFKGYRIPVREPDGTLNSPERWDHERIEKKKIFLGPAEAARQLEPLIARDDSQAKFKEDWITKSMTLGLGFRYYHSLDDLPEEEWEEGSIVVTGVDLAVSKRDSAGDTAMVTILVTPDKKRRILDVWGGKLSGPEIARKAIEISYRYNSTLVVESVGAQRFICQLINEYDPDVPVIAFETRKTNKWDPNFGVESLGGEMDAERWVVPNIDGQMPNDVYALLQDMLGFDPKGHTGDRLMACWMAREGARRLGQEGGGVFTTGASVMGGNKPAEAAASEPMTLEQAKQEYFDLLEEHLSMEQILEKVKLYQRVLGTVDILVKVGNETGLNNTLKQLPMQRSKVFGNWGDLVIVRSYENAHFTAWAMREQGYAEVVGVLDMALTKATLEEAA